MIFLVIGAVSAADTSVQISEDSNFSGDVLSSSVQNKLEVSNEDSISEYNSHDDNLGNSPINESLQSSVDSTNGDEKLLSASDVLAVSSTNQDENLSLSSAENNVVSVSSDDSEILSANDYSQSLGASANSKISTKITVPDTHYISSATYFLVNLVDNNGNAISNQKVALKINGKTYSDVTSSEGKVSIKTPALSKGTYSIEVNYAGNSKYDASSLSKKVKVLSSLKGSDLTKYYGSLSQYEVLLYRGNTVLANTQVSMSVAGKTYNVKTDNKGIAKLDINLAAGKYVITTTNPFSNEKLSNNIVVLKDSAVITPAKKNAYILPNEKYTYKVTVKNTRGDLIKNLDVTFKYNNKQVTTKTNKNGEAKITIPVLSKGTYKITYTTKDIANSLSSASGSGKLIVNNPTIILTSSKVNAVYNDGSTFNVKLSYSNGTVIANKNVKIKFNGKTDYYKTDSNGIAKLAIGKTIPSTYKVSYSYSTKGSKYYNYGSNTIVISKKNAVLSATNLNMKYKDGSYYTATVKNSLGKAIKNMNVKFTIAGKTYVKKTDENGIAKIKINLAVGYYSVKSAIASSCYSASAVSKKILVNGTKFVGGNKIVSNGDAVSYSVKLLDGKDNPIKNAKVVFTCNGKSYTKTTSSSGIAKVNLGKLSQGKYEIKYVHDSFSGSSKITVVTKVTINQLIAASATVNEYIQNNQKLPSSVKIGDYKFTTAQYLYLASKAIINLKNGDKSSISIQNVANPTNPKGASDMGNLNNYLSVAKSLVKTVESTGVMPNSVSSSVGTIGYKGLVYAFARVVNFYGDNGKIMPAYVSIKSLSTPAIAYDTGTGLNSKNTVKNLAPYLAASTNCPINNAKIKEVVTKLTKGLTSNFAKAQAIFNYVRDTISYSFYYDTKYGAVGTLNAKTGNCVDHSHLLVSMYRTAGLPARYVHGTCTFSSGTYGHVWTQVLVGDMWYVADATSTRNSFGQIVNWNTNSYSVSSISSSISF